MHKKTVVTSITCLLLPVLLFVSCTSSVSKVRESNVPEQPKVEAPVQTEESEEPEQNAGDIVTEEEQESRASETAQPVVPAPEVKEEKPAPQPLPEEAPVPTHKYQALVEYALELVNSDRIAHGLNPVELRGNSASQLHAEESLKFGYSSHWNLEGLKPYMRYTLSGGVNYVGENVIGTGIESAGNSPAGRDIEQLLQTAQEKFMGSPVHKANILNKWHKTVSMGIAYDDNNFHWVQHFEGDYIGFSTNPVISGTVLSMAGKVKTGTFERIVVYYDPLPQAMTPAQLNASPYDSSYSLGGEAGNILPPLSSGSFYTNLRQTDTVATKWDSWDGGWFDITAEISLLLAKGPGVYTIAVIANIGGELLPVTNYSVFIR